MLFPPLHYDGELDRTIHIPEHILILKKRQKWQNGVQAAVSLM
jgi:hypothetical protein